MQKCSFYKYANYMARSRHFTFIDTEIRITLHWSYNICGRETFTQVAWGKLFAKAKVWPGLMSQITETPHKTTSTAYFADEY